MNGDLPIGWDKVKLGEIAERIDYGYTAKAVSEPAGPKYLRITDIQNGKVRWEGVPYCRIRQDEKPAHTLQKGDLVFARTGATTGKSYLIDMCPDSVFASYLIRVRLRNPLLPEYVAGFFQSNDYWQQIQDNISGSAQPNCNATKLATIELPIPPLPEQRRIVAKLDELLGKVEACKERLERVPKLMKRFRQSVLDAATMGGLTAEWREKLHSTSTAARDLEEYFRSIIDNKGGTRPEDTEGHKLFTDRIPVAWASPRLEQVFSFIDYRGKTPKKSKQGKRLITAKNIRMGFLTEEPIEYVAEEYYRKWMTRGFPKKNDIFFVTEGATMGFLALNTREDEFALAQRTITLQPRSAIDTPVFLYFMMSSYFQRVVQLNATGSAAVGIKGAKLKRLPIPFPPFLEQQEIVRRVEALLSFADRIQSQYVLVKNNVDMLTNSIVAKAFRGELVPQDPNDEPANVLLERIRAEKQGSNYGPSKEVNRHERLTERRSLPRHKRRRASKR